MTKPVILTGVRSNDEPTLGNYLGGILPIVRLAESKAGDYQVNMFVPDLHSFTTPIDHRKLYASSIHNLELFVAAGLPIENDDVFIYRQSFISAHSELAWILSCFSGFGEASRMVEFKDKAKRLGEAHVSVGLFTYPILMTADILLYNAIYVPLGEDQRQHLELARDLAQRMNSKFGDLFVLPHDMPKQQAFIGRDSAPRIRSLKNPDKKMSKSVSDPAGTILLSDPPADAAKKVMGATTDSEGQVNFDFAKQPGVSNLLQILALLSEQPQNAVNAQWQGESSYGKLKQAVAESVEQFLTDLQKHLANVDSEQITRRLESSEYLMNEVARQKLHKVQKAVGLRP